MNEPWTTDFRALRDATGRDAPSAQRTRELVLASAKRPETKENDMSIWKRRPVLAVAIAIAFVAFLTPVAYAVVNKVFLSIDPDQSEEEIEEDVRRQLDEAGVETSSVRAEKKGDRLEIGIAAEGVPDGRDLDIEVRGPEGAHGTQRKMVVEAACDMTDDQTRALVTVVSSPEFLAAVEKDAPDAEAIAAMREVLRRHGFTAAEIAVTDGEVSITITAPPT